MKRNIDNHTSFTYNLVQRMGEVDPSLVIDEHRIDQITIAEIEAKKPSYSPISSGLRTPNKVGMSVAGVECAIEHLPFLGVCLGHQSIGPTTSDAVVRAKQFIQGKKGQFHPVSLLTECGDNLLSEIQTMLRNDCAVCNVDSPEFSA